MKKKGIAVISVPHRTKYYTKQDRLIGHYRRYEINQIKVLFGKNKLKTIKVFGIYGILMRIADIQSKNPEKIERGIQKLRDRYTSSLLFRKIWNIIVKIGAKLMKLDANYHSLNRIMNIALLAIKS